MIWSDISDVGISSSNDTSNWKAGLKVPSKDNRPQTEVRQFESRVQANIY